MIKYKTMVNIALSDWRKLKLFVVEINNNSKYNSFIHSFQISLEYSSVNTSNWVQLAQPGQNCDGTL